MNSIFSQTDICHLLITEYLLHSLSEKAYTFRDTGKSSPTTYCFAIEADDLLDWINLYLHVNFLYYIILYHNFLLFNLFLTY